MMTEQSRKALVSAIVIGTILQLTMILVGHWNEFVRMRGFMIGGLLISLIAGIIYARSSKAPRGESAMNGAVAGGLCALIGIVASFALGDVVAMIILVGTLGSAVAGAIGGALAGGAQPTMEA